MRAASDRLPPGVYLNEFAHPPTYTITIDGRDFVTKDLEVAQAALIGRLGIGAFVVVINHSADRPPAVVVR